MSAEENETETAEVLQPSVTRTKRYGSLTGNNSAKDKRNQMKFFDSAEWAMKLNKEERKQRVSAPLPRPTNDQLQKYLESVKSNQNSNSPLTV